MCLTFAMDRQSSTIDSYTSKSKIQVVYEQKFKDPLSSTCQISLERRVLDLESDVNQRPGFYSH